MFGGSFFRVDDFFRCAGESLMVRGSSSGLITYQTKQGKENHVQNCWLGWGMLVPWRVVTSDKKYHHQLLHRIGPLWKNKQSERGKTPKNSFKKRQNKPIHSQTKKHIWNTSQSHTQTSNIPPLIAFPNPETCHWPDIKHDVLEKISHVKYVNYPDCWWFSKQLKNSFSHCLQDFQNTSQAVQDFNIFIHKISPS